MEGDGPDRINKTINIINQNSPKDHWLFLANWGLSGFVDTLPKLPETYL